MSDDENITIFQLEIETLEERRSRRLAEVDKKTRELIAQGFVYNSVLFSASETAQRNWLGIDQLSSDLTYPFSVSTKDDGEYTFTDATEIHTFLLTGMGTVEYHYATGRALKQSLKAATNLAEIDAVVDAR